MKSFCAILAVAGLLLGACSSSPSGDPLDPSLPGDETVASAREAAAQGEPAGQPGSLEGGQTLEGQKRSFLRDRHLANARSLADELRFQEARDELLKAQAQVPDDLEVNRLLAFVLEQLGERPGSVASRGEAMNQEYMARLEKLKLEAMGAYARAEEHLAQKEYDKAIQRAREVKLHIQYGRSVDWGDLKSKAEALLARAEEEQHRAFQALQSEQEAETFRRLRKAEADAQIQRAVQIDEKWKHAMKLWQFEDFDGAAAMAEEILAVDPNHEPSQRLVDLAVKAARERNNRTYITERREQFRVWKNDLAETRIPYTNILERPSRNQWAKITKDRQQMRSLGLEGGADPAVQALEAKLESEKIGGSFPEGTPFADVVAHMVTVTGLPVILTRAAVEQVETDATEIRMELTVPISARAFLNELMKKNPNLTYLVQDGVVLITTKEKATGQTVVRVHDISDLAFGVTSFSAPKIDSMKRSDDFEGGPMGGPVGDPVKTIDPDTLTTLLKETVAPGTWETEGISCEPVHNTLVVVHTPEVQRRIIEFLEDLRRFTTSIVTIDAKFLTVSENWLQEVGVEWRGLGGEGDNPSETESQLDDVTSGLTNNASRGYDNNGTGVNTDPAAPPTAGISYDDGRDGDLRARTENIFGSALGSVLSTKGGATIGVSLIDDMQMRWLIRMVEKSAAFQVVNSQILSVMNTQRANVTMVQQVSYVKDFEVEVAQAAYIADPIVDVLQDGIVLDVKPTIMRDRRYITLEMRPTVAELQQPIPTFTTSLAGATLAVTLQLPQLRVRTVNTTVRVPDGGTVLIGGLKEIYNKERKASIPWLENLPLVSLLFKTEGKSDESRSLMVMVRAFITDMNEAMQGR